MNVVGLQYDIQWENKAANFDAVRALLTQAAPERNSLVVLPEMFATGFSMNTAAVAESYGSETEQFLSRTAREFGVCIIAGAAMRAQDGRHRNKALVFDSTGKLIAFYAKMHPFTLGGEADHYTAGEHPVLFQWADCNVAPFICYDLRFPELFREAAARKQPELFAVIANFPEKRIQHWVTLLQARAIENQAYVVGVNRIGTDPYYTYSGRSLIINPQGEIIADAGATAAAISAKLDLVILRKYREGLPFLKDMKR